MCIRNKPRTQRKRDCLRRCRSGAGPWKASAWTLTHLPKTQTGYTTLYVVIDRLTKVVHITPTTITALAADTAQLTMDMVFKHHGLLRNILSDRDVKFTRSFLTPFCEHIGIKLKMSSAYHPQSDGQTETMNRVIVDMMRHYISPTNDDWDEHLMAIEFAINKLSSRIQELHLLLPSRLTYGQSPLTPVSLKIPKVSNPTALKVTAGETSEGQAVLGRSGAAPESLCRSGRKTCRV